MVALFVLSVTRRRTDHFKASRIFVLSMLLGIHRALMHALSRPAAIAKPKWSVFPIQNAFLFRDSASAFAKAFYDGRYHLIAFARKRQRLKVPAAAR
ncbi:uncharacterized protein PHACADRAFT_265527 [Phanerochaete carnosa HHB-10118-sp]|uniref:Uncharacterized protein n=1 Tax=Phanerochaete carnosa (strain HHB-10118-sp) TaxID=650164 RepID=K5UJV1_PHACS|nr:uncharacterized protein PHACADRAFT_265527 [Phanerochaete carnosa HHB-10118-sp]EKM49821.1 hypothetical protein PHACADRAFT_265527 [Phanerochaete carnosa HHB-10118-sp]